jgi:hypothetical protein
MSWNRLYWYLAAGLPIAGGGHPLISAFLEETRAGVSIPTVSAASVDSAIRQVLDRLDSFGAASAHAYDTGLSYEAQVSGLSQVLGL